MTTVPVDLDRDDSDYGEFGDDVEALEILEQLIARADIDIDIEDDPAVHPHKVTDSTTHPKASLLDSKKKQKPTGSPEIPVSPLSPPSVPEDRSPFERFRKPPRKAFSVTDLVSPAWCELQYYYSLVEPRRKKKTIAMKRGTAVHQALEDEVHTTVAVEVTTKEDKWGLKLWNIIQGLRSLRDTGRTRELEIWGTVGGEVVNGIIDELSYECPVPGVEVEKTGEDKKSSSGDQTTLTDYFGLGQQPQQKAAAERMIYITDVKTRGSTTLPTGSSVRPTILQLHLYHHLLRNLIIGYFQLSQLADRYGLDVNQTFSDSFIAQLSAINQDSPPSAATPAPAPSPALSSSCLGGGVGEYPASQELAFSQDSLDILIRHNTLSSLWDYMMNEFRTTFLISEPYAFTAEQRQSAQFSFAGDTNQQAQNQNQLNPHPADQDFGHDRHVKTRLSNTLTVEYLTPNYKSSMTGTSKKRLGRKSFGFNATYLRTYLEDNMAWWHGQRAARGVELQDAWKCRSCDFRDDCRWIQDRDEASLKDALEKRKLRQAAGLEKTTKGIQRSEI